MRVTVEFDDYEAALLKRVRKELRVLAHRQGKKPPGMKDVVRGAVRMGVHTIYGEGVVSEGILSSIEYPELVSGFKKDLSQRDELDEDDST